MSDFPPPNIGPGDGSTPPPWSPTPPTSGPIGATPPAPGGFAPGGYTPGGYPPVGGTPAGGLVSGPPPAGGPGKSSTGKIVAAFVVVALLAGGVAYFVVRNNDKGSTKSAATTVATDASIPATDAATTTAAATTTTAAATTTTAAATTTTAAPTTTQPAPTTTVFAVPAGAIDLGHHVYIPVPAGWKQTNDPGKVITISDGTTIVAVQSLARAAGEDITALMQEYHDTFNADFAAVGFGETRFVATSDGPTPINQYSTFYTTYQPGNVNSATGTIFAFVRGDGLTVIADVYTVDGSSTTLPTDAFGTLRASQTNAAALGTAVALTPHDPFRVTSTTPFVEVAGLVGFSAPPGFNPFTSGNSHGGVSNGTEGFEVIKTPGQGDTHAVIIAAQSYLAQSYGNIAYNAPTEDAPDGFGVIHGTFTWSGTYLDGTPSAGRIDYYFDPSTTNGWVTYRNWFTTNGPGEPFQPEAAFMLRSFYASVTNIP